jgi:hypothetical protein
MNFLFQKDPFKKYDVGKKKFVDNLALLIVKNNLPLQFVECVVKTFGVAIVSLSSIPFLNVFFTQCFP